MIGVLTVLCVQHQEPSLENYGQRDGGRAWTGIPGMLKASLVMSLTPKYSRAG